MKKSLRLLLVIGLTLIALVAFVNLPPLFRGPSAKFVNNQLIAERSFNYQAASTDEKLNPKTLKILLRKTATRGGWISSKLVQSRELCRAFVGDGNPDPLWPERVRSRSLRGVRWILSISRQDLDFAERFGGVEALAKKCVPWILKRLKDDDVEIRIDALEILGKIPEFTDVIIPKIRATVESEPPMYQYTYPMRTIRIKGEPKPYVGRERRRIDGTARLHVSAGETLLQLDSSMRDEAASLWNGIFQDTAVNTDTRIAALSKLSEIDDPEARKQTKLAVALAKRKLANSSERFSYDTYQVFEWYGEALKDALPELLNYLEKNTDVESAPLNAISLPGHIAPESMDALRALHGFRTHADSNVRLNAVHGLNRIVGFNQELVDALQDFFDDTDGAVRSMAALFAWKRDPSLEATVLSILGDGLDSEESSVWGNSLYALKDMGDSGSRFASRLWRKLETVDDPLRALATLDALFDIDRARGTEIRSKIESYSESEHQAVQKRANWILAGLEEEPDDRAQ